MSIVYMRDFAQNFTEERCIIYIALNAKTRGDTLGAIYLRGVDTTERCLLYLSFLPISLPFLLPQHTFPLAGCPPSRRPRKSYTRYQRGNRCRRRSTCLSSSLSFSLFYGPTICHSSALSLLFSTPDVSVSVVDTIALDKSCDKLALLLVASCSIPISIFPGCEKPQIPFRLARWGYTGVENPRGDGEYTRDVSKEIYCRDKRVQRKTRVKSESSSLRQRKRPQGYEVLWVYRRDYKLRTKISFLFVEKFYLNRLYICTEQFFWKKNQGKQAQIQM